jgi:hypothetical protein
MLAYIALLPCALSFTTGPYVLDARPRASTDARPTARLAALTMQEDFRPDPPWQRDGIILLAYVGFETFLTSMSTGLKPQLGLDVAQLNAATGGALLVSVAWVLAATATGVVGAERFNLRRVALTWALSAPVAAALRVVLYAGFPCTSTLQVATDAVMTLPLMLGLRLAEEQGYL